MTPDQLEVMTKAVSDLGVTGVVVVFTWAFIQLVKLVTPIVSTWVKRKETNGNGNGNGHAAREAGYEAGEAAAKQDQILHELKTIAALLRETAMQQTKMLEALDYIKARVGELFHWKPSAESTALAHADFIERLEERVIKLEGK